MTPDGASLQVTIEKISTAGVISTILAIYRIATGSRFVALITHQETSQMLG